MIPDVPCTISVPELGRVRIRLRRHRWMLWEQFARSDTLTFGMFARLIRPGDVAYDIGANIGIYSRVMHQWFGAARVIAFEPMRDNFALLQRNIALGLLQPIITPHRIALSDADGEEQLQIDDMSSGTAVLSSVSGGQPSIGRSEFGLPALSESVHVVMLDHFIAQHQLARPTMMKIDTEGAEVKVLRGARQTLLDHPVRICLATHGDDKARDSIALLNDFGYSVFGFVQGGAARRGEYRELAAADGAKLANNNLVASKDASELRAEIADFVYQGTSGAVG
jgi:FkbM family methyltransferase